MKHPTTRTLFGYWDALRGERAAPERSELQPGAMRHVLGDAFILANEREPTFRLAGSRTCALFGRDLAGSAFRSIWRRDDGAEADRMTDQVLHDTLGIVAGALGVNANGSELALELVMLPLRHRQRNDRRLLGGLSPATLPSWAGLVPLLELQLRSVRIIETGTDEALAVAALAERRHQLVLHDGGRS